MEYEEFYDAVEYEEFYEAHDYIIYDDDICNYCDTAEAFLPETLSNEETTSGEDPSLDKPLYNGAKVTVSEISIAFLSLIFNNDISGELIGRFLAFVQLILPAENNFFSTLHSFFKYFEHLKSPLNFTYYCSICMRGVDKKDSGCPRCGKNVKVNYYIHLPLVHQIKLLYSNPAFVEALSYRFNRKKLVDGNIEDIYDGFLYKSVEIILSNPLNISLFWNTDGVSLYKSSNFQVWPFYFVINELPPHLRFKEEYMILAGLAFGNGKPAANIFMKPIWEETEILKSGFDVKLPHSDIPVNVKCIVLGGSCDALAKSAFMKLTNFNGFHGCPRCLARGQKEGNVFTYPFAENVAPRTLEGYKEHLTALKESGDKKPVYGVQGPTYLLKIVWTCFLTSTAIDVMHNVYLGVCRQLFFLWFSAPFIKEVFGETVDRKPLLEKLSAVLCDMKAPHYLSRPPRPLCNAKYFKAAEFRTWLFSTALPLLQEHMKDKYFEYFKKLVCAISLLNQASISNQDLELATSLLLLFVCEFQELFGVRNMSFNVHCLTHLPDVVRALGPLWASSCFGFESLNGKLARLVHGTRHAGLQIYSYLGLLRNLTSLIGSVTNSSVKAFCKSMISKSAQLKVVAKVDRQTKIVGKFVREHILPPNFNNLLCSVTSVCSNYSFFFRLEKCRFLYVAEDYGKGSRDSSCVQYVSESGHMKYGSVKVFVKVSNCSCVNHCEHNPKYYALVQNFQCTLPFHTTGPNATISSIFSCAPNDDLDCVPISSLVAVCFKMKVDENLFLSVPLNPYELE